ncbi:peptidase domain-containing ABC transporter [Pseudogulbenkiania ferrooxidans]|uniref:peptidase domain-containing ABC transporter n=1 Tax=Pseudogulbenkiania ferrooxidans TaxID=549169 RepID=UPI000401B2E8|nr:peptidase domain-containing ABC transporter [Pseudogulbenkiania ferrooxidans]
MTEISSLQYGFGRKLPLILQTEMSECGLACLAMISSYHGYVSDIQTLRRSYSISWNGTTLEQLIEYANHLKMAARPLRLEIEELKCLQTPCILHWGLDHYVVLKEIRKEKLIIHDPAFGVKRLSLKETSNYFTGVALELAPTPIFERREDVQSISLKSLVEQIIGLKRALLQVFSLSLVLELLIVLAPFFQQWVVDGVIVQNDKTLLKVLAIGFFLLMIIQMLINALRSWIITFFSTQLSMQWMAGVFTKLLSLPIEYFEKRHLGDVLSRFESIDAIRQTLTAAALTSLLDGFMVLLTLGMMFLYNAQLAFISLAALLFYILIRVLTYDVFRTASEEQIVLSAKQNSHLMESLRGVQSIKLFNREYDRRSQWLNLVVSSTNRKLETQRMQTLYQFANGIIFGVEGILVTYLGATLVMENQFTIGMLFAYGSYKMQFTSRVGNLVDLFYQVKILRIQRERLADIMLTPAEFSDEEATLMQELSENVNPVIELRDIKFQRAINEPWILNGVSLSILSGQTVAIVGMSGCGKTTLLKIMLGLLKANSGDIIVNGILLKSSGLRSWRETLGVVMQDDQLFAGTIAENIAFFDRNIDIDKVVNCAQLASIHEDILSMSMGYLSRVGDMGSSLSGGQKQRIIIARALYKKPSVLFMDEATSHLDIETERAVNLVIRQLPLTKIIIAHRPETIRMADRVFKIENGQIYELSQDELSVMKNKPRAIF